MKKVLGITLGILTAIGGFVDIGDIVAASQAGARFGIRHAWVLVVGVTGICVYAEMCGRGTDEAGTARCSTWSGNASARASGWPTWSLPMW